MESALHKRVESVLKSVTPTTNNDEDYLDDIDEQKSILKKY
jgi:hypothetical protein